MWKKATIGGLAAVALVAGGAGVAIAHAEGTSAPAAATATPTGSATTGTATTAPGAAATTKTKGSGKTKGAGAAKDGEGKAVFGKLKDLQHAEWVTKATANASVTHEAILGKVQSVSATSITVASADGTSMTFAVNDKTAVRQHAKKGAAAGATTPTIADVKTGQTVLVAGSKAPDLTAQHVLVRAG